MLVSRPRLILAAILSVALPASVLPASAQVTGDLRTHEFHSDIFGNSRMLRIWLPPGYSEDGAPDGGYPVLYLNDGQNLFDAATSLFGGGEWRVDETVTGLVRAGRIPPIVVVGIDNGGREGRAYEYLPYPDDSLEPPVPDPAGHLYDDFLADEVLPFVERRYPVDRSPEGRALGGSSYGALAALHAALERPDLFGRLLLESPSFYVDDYRIFREADAAAPGLERVYLGVGTNELGLEGCPEEHEVNAEAVAGVEHARRFFTSPAGDAVPEVRTVVEPCATHGEDAWARRLPGALEFLFAE